MRKYILYIAIIVVALSGCKKVTLVLYDLPENTPENSPIYISGSFNYWDPADANYKLQRTADGLYRIDLPWFVGDMQYQFTRGDWSSVEANKCGNDKPKYALHISLMQLIGKNAFPDTLFHEIESWKDKEPLNCDSVTIVIQDQPTISEQDTLVLTGNINAWNPGNSSDYLFKKDSQTGKLYTRVPLNELRMRGVEYLEFLVAKGNSLVPEVDEFGLELEKRKIKLGSSDSVFVNIKNWEGQTTKRSDKVTIVVQSIPENTPWRTDLYLVGNFNNWFPADNRYRFTKQDDGTYSISIPRGKYGLSFKITRGSWNSEAADACGLKWSDQNYNYADIDTLFYDIKGWKDLPSERKPFFVIVLENIPDETPVPQQLYVVSNYNGWNFASMRYPFEEENGKLVCKIRSRNNSLQYKVTRGSWMTQEVNEQGEFIYDRVLDPCQDTMFINVERWYDIILPSEPVRTVLVEKVPDNTRDRPIYITGTFNDWNPEDEQFILKKQGGKYFINLPLRWFPMGYKFTQGSWFYVEGDKHNNFLENRKAVSSLDTLRVRIDSWENR